MAETDSPASRQGYTTGEVARSLSPQAAAIARLFPFGLSVAAEGTALYSIGLPLAAFVLTINCFSKLIEDQFRMLSDKDKNQIVERLRIEEQIRSELHPVPLHAHKFPWLENKAFLLFAGFVLTGVLVPILQYSQETITWKRQNRYDNIKYRLTMMRDGSAQFVQLWALTVQTYQQAQPYLQKTTLDPSEYAAFESRFVELENRGADQSAKVSSLLIYFPGRVELAEPFEEFLRRKTVFIALLKDQVAVKQAASAGRSVRVPTAGAPTAENSTATERKFRELDQVYGALIEMMKRQIESIEKENEKFM